MFSCLKAAYENKVVKLGKNRFYLESKGTSKCTCWEQFTCQAQIMNLMDLLVFSLKIQCIRKYPVSQLFRTISFLNLEFKSIKMPFKKTIVI